MKMLIHGLQPTGQSLVCALHASDKAHRRAPYRRGKVLRRFLMHVLPKGFHRIRHYGLFANASRAENIATARVLLNVAPLAADPQEPPDIATDTPRMLSCPCPRCGGRMIVIETFAPGCEPRWRPMPSRIDTS
jgi:Putative transposase